LDAGFAADASSDAPEALEPEDSVELGEEAAGDDDLLVDERSFLAQPDPL
jgi:hypothetical protein